ncbi:site-specific integrase [Candidatus Woesearchaeota archaeon]|nr:site-specific integrase [Candidatus Woesearchaeota archaeon]
MQTKKRLQYISNNDIIRLESAITSLRDRLLLQTLYETGCTINEAVSLTSEAIDVRNNTITFPADITKSKKAKTAWVSGALMNSISEHLNTLQETGRKTRYIFSSRQSAQMTTKRARQLITAYGKEAGLGKVLPQMIRYAHVLHAVEKGIPLDAVEKQTGIDKIRLVQICEAVAKPEPEDPYRTFFESNPYETKMQIKTPANTPTKTPTKTAPGGTINRRKRHEKTRR